MGALIGYELRKILSRRIVWGAIALGLFLLLYSNGGISLIRARLGGRVQGMRDVYAQYEGQVLTDAVAAEAGAALNAYIAQNPDEFVSHEDENGVIFSARDSYGYADGVWTAYMHIAYGTTYERKEKTESVLLARLESGTGKDGKPLTWREQCQLVYQLKEACQSSVIVYSEGYRYLMEAGQIVGVLALGLLLLILPPLFAGEAAARMESVLLCAAGRKRAVRAKMAVAFAEGLGVWMLFYGGQILMIALTYGLAGAGAPYTGFYDVFGWTMGGMLMTYLAVSLITTLAMAAVIAWMSAIFNRPLTALAGGAGTVIAQLTATIIVNRSLGYHTVFLPFVDSPAADTAIRAVYLLPASALWPWTGGYTLTGAGGGMTVVLICLAWAIPAIGLSLGLGPMRWLRQRKA